MLFSSKACPYRDYNPAYTAVMQILLLCLIDFLVCNQPPPQSLKQQFSSSNLTALHDSSRE
jgi:hypothetical protein